jgi:hypothetical protein
MFVEQDVEPSQDHRLHGRLSSTLLLGRLS